MRSKTVLFVCFGNICRSPMAEVLLKKMLLERLSKAVGIRVLSAGLSAYGGYVTGEAFEVMRKEGVDLSDFRSKPLTEEMVKKADLILTMERLHKNTILSLYPKARGRAFTLKEFAGEATDLDIADPYGRGMKAYEACAEEIKRSLIKAFERNCCIFS